MELFDIQWNPSITDTIGKQNLVRYSEVSLTRVSGVYSLGVVYEIGPVSMEVPFVSKLWFLEIFMKPASC